MNVWLFVKVVAILTDVVQGGEYGRVISPSALVRHPAITLTDRVNGGGQYLMPSLLTLSPADKVGGISGIFCYQRQDGIIGRAGQAEAHQHQHHGH